MSTTFVSYDVALLDIFKNGAGERIQDAAEERELIRTVQAGSDIDGSATLRLMYAYAPVLRSEVQWFYRAANARGVVPTEFDHEEVRSRAVEGLLKAVRDFDEDKGHERLAAVVKHHVLNEVVEYAASTLEFTVSTRTLKRFFSVLRAADYNVYKALALCGESGPGKDLSKSAFLSILSAMRDVDSYDAPVGDEDEAWDSRPAAALWEHNAIEEVESRVLVEMVFSEMGDENDLDDRERDVLLYKYGFRPLSEDYGDRAISDAMVAREIGSTRPTVARVHGKALDKARSRLGA